MLSMTPGAFNFHEESNDTAVRGPSGCSCNWLSDLLYNWRVNAEGIVDFAAARKTFLYEMARFGSQKYKLHLLLQITKMRNGGSPMLPPFVPSRRPLSAVETSSDLTTARQEPIRARPLRPVQVRRWGNSPTICCRAKSAELRATTVRVRSVELST